jgi:hypothetical protein
VKEHMEEGEHTSGPKMGEEWKKMEGRNVDAREKPEISLRWHMQELKKERPRGGHHAGQCERKAGKNREGRGHPRK